MAEDKKEEKSRSFKPEHSKEVKEIFIYILFMICFTMYTVRGTLDANVFYFGEQLKGQLFGVEMKAEHSPTFGKNFNDVATVEEWYHWMLGPMSHTAFLVNNFDGINVPEGAMIGPNGTEYVNSYKKFYNGNGECNSHTCGYTLGYGKIIGGIRISQLRSELHECNAHVYSVLSANHTFMCTGSADNSVTAPVPYGAFNLLSETKEPYGNFSIHEPADGAPDGALEEWAAASADDLDKNDHIGGMSDTANRNLPLRGFRYDGVKIRFPNNSDVLYDLDPIEDTQSVNFQRDQLYSTLVTRKWNAYPSPAYSIVLPPTLQYAQAQQVIQDLYKSRYIDKQTRAIFVDMTVYNPMLDRIAFVRIVGEITTAGGVMPTSELDVIRLWELVTNQDTIFLGLQCVVGVFYLYYFLEMIPVITRHGWAAFEDFLFCAQLANIVFFIVTTAATWYAETLYPATLMPDGSDYIDMHPSVRFKIVSSSVGAVNVFLNWFKLISILSYDPQFGIVYNTLGRAASGVGGFSIIFFIIFYGFGQSHAMIFNGRLENFRTVTQSLFSLLRSLLGDFDFEELQEANRYMGTLLFILFEVLAVFVVLNMLIAIISEAYETCREEMKDYPPVNLRMELWQYFLSVITSWDCIYKLVKACCKKTYNQIHVTDQAAEEVDAAADEQAKMMAKSPIESAMEDAMNKMKSNSPSDLILVEWFDSLKQNEEDMSNLQKDMTHMKQEIQGLSGKFTHQLDQITLTAQLLDNVTQLIRDGAAGERTSGAPSSRAGSPSPKAGAGGASAISAASAGAGSDSDLE
jgi:hypothetical protein